MNLSISDFDWHNLLVKKYINYGLDELDCMVLFVSDAILNMQDKTLLTSDILAQYMKADETAIDLSLSKLMEKKYLVLINENNSFYTSIDSFKEKLFKDSLKDYNLESKYSNITADDTFYSDVEKICAHSLSPLERDYISRWLKDGVKQDLIKEALTKAASKKGNISFKKADSIILDMERSNSRTKTGSVSLTDKSGRQEELRDLINNTDWTYHE